MDLSVGDHCWMLNAIRNRAFLCTVRSVGDGVIEVENHDKNGRRYRFDVAGGTPEGDYVSFDAATPVLVPYDDRVALHLAADRIDRRYREQLTRLLGRLPDPELFDVTIAMLSRWRAQRVQLDADEQLAG